MTFVRKSEKIAMLAVLCFFVGPFVCCADKVILRSGEVVEGLIIDKNPRYVILYSDGKSNVFSTFQVTRIVHEELSSSSSKPDGADRSGVVATESDSCNSVSECSRSGSEALAKKDADRALMFFNAAIRYDPRNVNALDGICRAQMIKGEGAEDEMKDRAYLEALKSADEVVMLDPSRVFGWLLRAQVLRRLGRFKEAIADCDKAIAIAPLSDRAYSVRAASNNQLGNYENAIRDFSRSIALPQLRTTLSAALRGRAQAYLKKNELDRAKIDCDRAIQVDPVYADSYALRAEIFAAGKDYGRAWADVLKTQELGGNVSPVFLDELRKNAPSS